MDNQDKMISLFIELDQFMKEMGVKVMLELEGKTEISATTFEQYIFPIFTYMDIIDERYKVIHEQSLFFEKMKSLRDEVIDNIQKVPIEKA